MNVLRLRVAHKLLLALAIACFLSSSARADDSATLYKAKCAACHGAEGGRDARWHQARARGMTCARPMCKKCPMRS